MSSDPKEFGQLDVAERYVLITALHEFAEGELEAADDKKAEGLADERAALIENAEVAHRLIERFRSAE